jgi:hypothetical protein
VQKNIFVPCRHYRYEDSVNDSSRIKEQWWINSIVKIFMAGFFVQYDFEGTLRWFAEF